MKPAVRTLVRLAELWLDRAEPAGRAPRDVLILAESLASHEGADIATLAFAWRTLEAMYRTLGWEISISPELARCRSAADSCRQTAWATLEEVLASVPPGSGPVLVLGRLGFTMAVMGEPDVLPASGALLVAMDSTRRADVSATRLAAAQGVRWVKPGRLLEALSQESIPWEVEGRTLLLPPPALVTAFTAAGAFAGSAVETLLFAAAWMRAGDAIPCLELAARTTGDRGRVAAAAWRLGLGPAPGLLTRLRFGLAGLGRRRAVPASTP